MTKSPPSIERAEAAMHRKRLAKLMDRLESTKADLNDAAFAAASDGMTITQISETIGMSRTWSWKLVQRGQDQAKEREPA